MTSRPARGQRVWEPAAGALESQSGHLGPARGAGRGGRGGGEMAEEDTVGKKRATGGGERNKQRKGAKSRIGK